jgi:hypothetical protein
VVVVVDGLGEGTIVIFVGVDSHPERKAHADMAGRGRVTDAQSRHGEHLVGQAQNVGDRVGMIADDADRATTQTGCLSRKNKTLHYQSRVDGRVEEPFKLAVLLPVAPDLADPFQPAGVAAKQ